MSTGTVAKDEFQKSLQRLESMAKSQLFHTPSDSSPGAWAGSSPEDENEHEDGIDENGTDYNGVKKSLAGKFNALGAVSKAELAIIKGQNPYPLIAEKVSKGQGLTAVERWALKGGRKTAPFAQFAKSAEASGTEGGAWQGGKSPGKPGDEHGADGVPPTNAGSNAEDKEKEADAKKGIGMPSGKPPFAKNDGDGKHGPDCDCPMCAAKKSFGAAAGSQPNLSKGIEVSPILFEMTRALDIALQGVEGRVKDAVFKSLSPICSRIEGLEKSVEAFARGQGDFNESMAKAVVGIGQQVAGGADAAAAAASQPVGAPRSQMRAIPGGKGQEQGGVTPVQKSFGPGGLDVGADALAKSQVVEVMGELVKSKKMNPLDLIKFESTGEISPAAQQMVMAYVQGGGR